MTGTARENSTGTSGGGGTGARQGGAAHTMQCMEVWGSNRAGRNGVIMPGLDAWVYSRPAADDDAGGDIHYVSACATGRVVRALVADVSGHGASVAGVSGDLRALMRRYINFVDQRRFLDSLNRKFRGLDETGRFATAVVVTCWTPTDEITISCAGHPAPLLYRAGAREWSSLVAPEVEGADFPLGIHKSTSFRENRVRLREGDLLLLYTDGVLEARDPGGRRLGVDGLLGLLATLDATGPGSILADLLGAMERFQGGRAPDDDMTLMLLGPNDLKPRPSLKTGLLAGTRIAAGALGSLLRRSGPPIPEMTRTNVLGAFSGRFNTQGRARP